MERGALDFGGVYMIGQCFADEAFRVWAKAHPQVTLVATRKVPTVELMVKRVVRRSRTSLPSAR